MLLEWELQGATAALAATNVPVIVLKGPALARTIYAERALRPYSDLDLTVHESDEQQAATALVEHGFTELPFEMEASQRTLVGHLHDAGKFHRMFAGPTGR